MSPERAARAVLRLIPAALAVFELRFLFTAAARLLTDGRLLSGASLSSPATWLMLALACSAVFFLRETGRGLLAAVAAGQLILGHTSLAHEHAFVTTLGNAGPLPLLAVGGMLVVAGVVTLTAVAHQLAAAHSPPGLVLRADRLQHPPGRRFVPSPAPLLAGLGSRGPPRTASL